MAIENYGNRFSFSCITMKQHFYRSIGHKQENLYKGNNNRDFDSQLLIEYSTLIIEKLEAKNLEELEIEQV